MPMWASQYVADHSEETRFIRSDDWRHLPPDEKLGEEGWKNLPWYSMQYEINEKPYTVVYMSHPSNPGISEMSERRYGRFGEFIPYQLAQDDSPELRHRFWIITGESLSAVEIQQQFQIYLGLIDIVET